MAKSSALRIRVDPELHREFLDACRRLDVPAAQVLRQYMRRFVDGSQDSPQVTMFDDKGKQGSRDA